MYIYILHVFCYIYIHTYTIYLYIFIYIYIYILYRHPSAKGILPLYKVYFLVAYLDKKSIQFYKIENSYAGK